MSGFRYQVSGKSAECEPLPSPRGEGAERSEADEGGTTTAGESDNVIAHPTTANTLP